jgi:hypothetical protein
MQAVQYSTVGGQLINKVSRLIAFTENSAVADVGV